MISDITNSSSFCPFQVFWFRSFKDPPGCFSDPCKGLNLNRKYSELPYAPSLKDGNCYQLGSVRKQIGYLLFYNRKDIISILKYCHCFSRIRRFVDLMNTTRLICLNWEESANLWKKLDT